SAYSSAMISSRPKTEAFVLSGNFSKRRPTVSGGVIHPSFHAFSSFCKTVGFFDSVSSWHDISILLSIISPKSSSRVSHHRFHHDAHHVHANGLSVIIFYVLFWKIFAIAAYASFMKASFSSSVSKLN
ncbi:MAG: hypothetical protein WA151_21310, partial [Desulfatirhabdiaceae bacterium]